MQLQLLMLAVGFPPHQRNCFAFVQIFNLQMHGFTEGDQVQIFLQISLQVQVRWPKAIIYDLQVDLHLHLCFS